MNDRLESFCLHGIAFGSMLVFFVPLLITSGTFFPFIFGKMIAFQVLVEIQFSLWVLLLMARPEYRPNFKHPVVFFLTCFMAIIGITSLLGVDPLLSFWSTQERMTGAVSLAHLYAWFLILTSVCKTWSDWRRLLLSSLVASLMVSCYALAQFAGASFVIANVTGERFSSTLGNPIYLGIYAMIHVYLGILFAFIERSRAHLVLCVAVVLLNFLMLIMSSSRGILFVFASSMTLTAVLAVGYYMRARWRLIVLCVCAVFFAVGFGTFMWSQSANGNAWVREHAPAPLKRIVEQGLFDRNRLELWRIGLMGFQDRPLTGWGIENYGALYARHALPDRNGVRVQDAWFDRSHNELIDILSLTGIGGLLLYLLAWLSLIYLLMRRVVQKTMSSFPAILVVVLLLAYFAQNLTVFDSTVPLIFFFGLFALGCWLAEGVQSAVSPAVSKRIFSLAVPGVALALVFTLYHVNYVPFTKSSLGIRALTLLGSNQPTQALLLFEQALDSDVYTNHEIRRALADAALGRMERTDVSRLAIRQMESSVAEKPHELRNYLLLSSLYRAAPFERGAHLERATRLMQSAIERAPNRVDLYYELAHVFAERNDEKNFLKTIEQARRLDPNSPKPYLHLAIGDYTLKRYKDVLPALERARNMNGFNVHSTIGLLVAFAKEVPSATLTDGTLAQFEKLISSIQSVPDVQVARRALYVRANKEDPVFGELTRTSPAQAELLTVQVRMFLQQK